jgi:hypothetical protein
VRAAGHLYIAAPEPLHTVPVITKAELVSMFIRKLWRFRADSHEHLHETGETPEQYQERRRDAQRELMRKKRDTKRFRI